MMTYISDELCRSGFTLSSNNDGSLLLDGSVDDVLGSLRVLLRDLLRLYCGSVFLREGQMSDGHIIQQDVEIVCSLRQQLSDLKRHHVSLGQQLGGVVLSHHSLGNLIDDRGKNSLIEV